MIGIYRISYDTLIIPIVDCKRSFATNDYPFQGSGQALEFIVEGPSCNMNSSRLLIHRGRRGEVSSIRRLDHVRRPAVNVVQSVVNIGYFIAPPRSVDTIAWCD